MCTVGFLWPACLKSWTNDDADQPTYYHFHIHVVHVMAEATSTQSVGKAFGLENLISQLETMAGGPEASMADVSLTYYLGTAHDLWSLVFQSLKDGNKNV